MPVLKYHTGTCGVDQWVKHLSHKHEDLSLHPKNQYKNQAGMVMACNPSVQKAETLDKLKYSGRQTW